MKVVNINKGWKFYLDQADINSLETADNIGVNLPHTWNNLDGQDGGNNYLRCVSFYQKELDINKKDDKEYYLEFQGVNAIAQVYVNGEFVQEHKGGFSTFRINITKHIQSGLNIISVSVDNRDSDSIYPQTADFTFFGGIYRDVNIIEVGQSRFDLDYFGSQGIKITPTLDKDNNAVVEVESFVTSEKENLDVVYEIRLLNKENIITTNTVKSNNTLTKLVIKNPLLWNGVKEPNLYEMTAKLIDNGEIIDERVVNFGVRSFSVDKNGFYLNGKKYALHGVSRHQDRLDKGWAISKQDHKQDMDLIKEIGATTIRLAHYQHDQYFYNLCDENGMVVWAEIPYISVHLKNGDENAISQMRELVIQNYNHPSIMFWGLSNEITIGGECPEQLELHKTLNKLVKDLDSTRLTTMAAVTMCDLHSPLLDIPDIFSYNHYFGWYMGQVSDNATWIDDFRKEFPNKPLGYSEYGCEANTLLHSVDPKQGDYSEEYQAYYHEEMAKIFAERDWMWSTHCWNMFDFAVDNRDEGGVKGRNNKGLVTYDREIKKDSFYLYKAYWSDEPFVHICETRFKKRKAKSMIVKVYSNQPSVTLFVGDKLIETKEENKVFTFEIPLKLGNNKITAVADGIEDKATFKRCLIEKKSYKLKKEKKVNNWFEINGVKYEFKYPAGKFSIKDKFGTIYKTEEGKKVLIELVGEALKIMGLTQDPEGFINKMKGLISLMSIERIANMAGDKISKEMLYHVNEALNQIDKSSK